MKLLFLKNRCCDDPVYCTIPGFYIPHLSWQEFKFGVVIIVFAYMSYLNLLAPFIFYNQWSVLRNWERSLFFIVVGAYWSSVIIYVIQHRV